MFFKIIFLSALLSLTTSDMIKSQLFHHLSISDPYYTNIRTNFTTIPEFYKIPDLHFSYWSAHPVLCEIQFQGSCSSLIENTQTIIRFKYDNQYAKINDLELKSPVKDIVTSCSKFGSVYFPAGTHTIDVEIQTFGGIKIYFGELFIKMTESACPSVTESRFFLLSL
ncbi:unnamed protein product [Rotaria sp. Silwood1]|nr:unnamed protein product [Rotaria sp. Silwood1]